MRFWRINKHKEVLNNNIRIDKGTRAIFVPHSAGLYVNINLTNADELESDKYFKCNAILNIDNLDNDLRELLWYIFIILVIIV